ncbi:FkbM family methyltransferase [Rhodophyticola porphyridii]|uniref:FkbM family methyltransferase n=1 Tax=Rhodophyticola porphyridii TaxID=1852017 RepID=UPI0035D04CBA
MSAPFETERATYLYDVLSPERLTRIVDVGANPLEAAPYEGLLKAGLCEVWGFEPQPERYDELVAEAGPHEHYLPHAIGADGPATLNICQGSGFTSLLEPNMDTLDAIGRMRRGATVKERVEIVTKPLDGLEDLPDFDLLKIDIQGGETVVFEHGVKKLRSALAVITEVAAIPLYVDQPLIDAQMQSLRKLGYQLHKFLFLKTIKFFNAHTSRLQRRFYRSQAVDGDAVFLRALLDIPSLGDEELKHLAMLSDAVLLSQDITVTAMGELSVRGKLSEDQLHGYIDRLPHVDPR